MEENKNISTEDILKVKELLSKNSIIPVKGMLAYYNDKGEFVPMKTTRLHELIFIYLTHLELNV